MRKGFRQLKGRYRFYLPPHLLELEEPFFQSRKQMMRDGYIIVPNTIVREGEQAMLQALYQDVTTNWVAGGANFEMGLCDQTPVETDSLASITTEPTAAGGYARQTIPRSAAGWPTEIITGTRGIRSALQTFTASGADFSRAISRAFLTNGTVLFSYSAALTSSVLVTDGSAISVAYENYLD